MEEPCLNKATCKQCKKPMLARRSTKKYCSGACQRAAHRAMVKYGVVDHDLELQVAEEMAKLKLKAL